VLAACTVVLVLETETECTDETLALVEPFSTVAVGSDAKCRSNAFQRHLPFMDRTRPQAAIPVVIKEAPTTAAAAKDTVKEAATATHGGYWEEI